MGLFDKLFGKKTEPSAPPPLPAKIPPRPVEDLRQDPNLVRVYDKYGREMFITKQEWRTNILPGTIRAEWNKPDQLYSVILSALNDGFRSDVIEAARQLHRIDTDPGRGACILGIVLMEEGRLHEAEKIFTDFLSRHGEAGYILTNLAKVHSRRGDHARSEEILWRALEVDPNQDNAVGWYEVIYRERSGEAAGQDALRRIAALPGSWRPQLWLARYALVNRQTDAALAFYHEALARAPQPLPADLLMQISGDLGNHGHLPEILQIVEPHFDPARHGMQVGNNLIKAHVDLGQLPAARRILDQLYALNRLDWRDNLAYWDTEIARAKISVANTEPPAPLQLAMLTGPGPVWLKPDSPAAELFPAKPADSPVICLIGSSAEIATNSKRIERQLADAPGRLSRALPLFLAEQIELATGARTQTLVPWINQPAGGFVLSGAAWADDEAAAYAGQGELKGDYIVVSHLNTTAQLWTAELRLIRTIDGHRLGQLTETFSPEAPTDAILRLATRLRQLLRDTTDVQPQPVPADYAFPAGAHFPLYLLRLEQLLAVRCSALEGVGSEFLNGEREILEGNLQQCLDHPASVSVRLLFAQTLLAMKRVRPEILAEFRERIALLQTEHPLPQPAHGVVERLLQEARA